VSVYPDPTGLRLLHNPETFSEAFLHFNIWLWNPALRAELTFLSLQFIWSSGAVEVELKKVDLMFCTIWGGLSRPPLFIFESVISFEQFTFVLILQLFDLAFKMKFIIDLLCAIH
jgi:hypothetical protein